MINFRDTIPPDTVRATEVIAAAPDSIATSAAPEEVEYGDYDFEADTVVSHPTPGWWIPADTIAADTIVSAPKKTAFIIDAPEMAVPVAREDSTIGMSVIVGGVLLLFCVTGLRFRNDRKYITALFRNIVEVRERNNIFDETVHETLFLVLLNVIWGCCAGIILRSFLLSPLAAIPEAVSESMEAWPTVTEAICMGVMLLYACFMLLAYTTVGSVFADRQSVGMWIKGYAATQGFLGVIYLPLSLMILFYPEWNEILLLVSAILFILSKIVFIWKGFRIFFTQISSWVLFLYYLCSLELVPLIITYLSAVWLCGFLKA